MDWRRPGISFYLCLLIAAVVHADVFISWYGIYYTGEEKTKSTSGSEICISRRYKNLRACGKTPFHSYILGLIKFHAKTHCTPILTLPTYIQIHPIPYPTLPQSKMRPTPPLTRKLTRLRLTTKQAANKGGYYKGTGTGAMGWHTKHGGYVIDWAKVRTYVVPAELGDCKVCLCLCLCICFVFVFWDPPRKGR